MSRLVLLAVASLLATCATNPLPAPKYPAVCPTGGAQLEVLTINAGLAPGVVRLATPRVKPFAREIAKLRDADLLCIQEVWTRSEVREVEAALNLPPERLFRADTFGKAGPRVANACSSRQLKKVAECVRKNCAGESDEDTTVCALENCERDLVDLYVESPGCIDCLVASVGGSMSQVIKACTSGSVPTRVYDGGNGTLLVSRWPLENREAVDLPSSGVNRVALFATVRPPGSLEPIEVACAHISTQLPVPPSASGFSDWEEEQSAQIRLISDRLRQRAGNRPAIFAGDMNAGPDLGNGTTAASESVWKLILQLGFTSPASQLRTPFCSDCRDNNLRSSRNQYLIDHVLLRDPPGGATLEPACAYRFLDRKFPITGYRGEPVETDLSDHYGVGVRFLLK